MKEQVVKYEKVLIESREIIEEIQNLLIKLANNHQNYQELKQYYGSEEYLKDVEISNNTDQYADIACGVLSEDEVFNLITSTYETSVTMLEVATKILKDH